MRTTESFGGDETSPTKVVPTKPTKPYSIAYTFPTRQGVGRAAKLKEYLKEDIALEQITGTTLFIIEPKLYQLTNYNFGFT